MRLEQILNELQEIIESGLSNEEIRKVETFFRENFNEDGTIAWDMKFLDGLDE